MEVIDSVASTTDEVGARKALLEKLNRVVASLWPERSPLLEPFGSSANGFGFKNADLDLTLTIKNPPPKNPGPRKGGHFPGARATRPDKLVEALSRGLAMKKVATPRDIQALSRARIPIVKFTDRMYGIQCDVCINNRLALRNTELLAAYVRCDARFRYLGLLVKLWAKRRGVNSPYNGTLSSYAWLLLVITHLQTRPQPVLPRLQQIEHSADARWLEGPHDCYFFSRDLETEVASTFGGRNKESLMDLALSFFRFFAHEFDYTHDVVCPRLGGYISKSSKGWDEVDESKPRDGIVFAVEDPFERSHNLGRVVDADTLRLMRREMARAARVIVESGGDINLLCKKFEGEEEEKEIEAERLYD
jgi:DNA polymerase sigma